MNSSFLGLALGGGGARGSVTNNGGGTDGQEYTFDPISVSAGDDILLAKNPSDILTYFDNALFLWNKEVVKPIFGINKRLLLDIVKTERDNCGC